MTDGDCSLDWSATIYTDTKYIQIQTAVACRGAEMAGTSDQPGKSSTLTGAEEGVIFSDLSVSRELATIAHKVRLCALEIA